MTQSYCYHILILFLSAALKLSRSENVDDSFTVTDSVQHFSKDLYKNLDFEAGNMVVSPLSIFTSLSMTSLGARGRTQEQLAKTLKLAPDSMIRSGAMVKMLSKLRETSPDEVEFEMGNFMWVPRGVSVKSSYARRVHDIFQTRVRDADFSRPEEVRLLINKRISNMTRGFITDLLPSGSISTQTAMMLANAVYFKGAWFHPFNESDTKTKPFFTDSSNSIDVPMMQQSELFYGGVFDELNAKAILMNYQDVRYGLLLVLPHEKDGLGELETKIMNSNWTTSKFMRYLVHRDVNVTLPKFDIKFDCELSDILYKMGIEDLFNQADLSGISDSPLSKKMKLSKAYHQAGIEINEGGSVAYAATGFEITPLMGGFGKHRGPIEFNADHPFMFYLIDKENDNIPIFMGRVMDPSVGQISTRTKTTNRVPVVADPVAADVLPSRVPAAALVKPFVGDRTESDAVIFPQEEKGVHPRLKLNKNHLVRIHPVVSDDVDRRIAFPDDELDSDVKNVKKREASPIAFPDEEVVDNQEDTSLRIKDKNWFKKPPVAEVFVPLIESEDNSPSDTSSTTTTTTTTTTTPPTTTTKWWITTTKTARIPLPTSQSSGVQDLQGIGFWNGCIVYLAWLLPYNLF